MSWKVHPTDEVFAALRGLCSNSYRMYDPEEYRHYYDHDCETYECAVEEAAREYERLLKHCNHQREQLAKRSCSQTIDILMELLNEYRESECAIAEDRVTYYADRLDGRTEDERMEEWTRTEQNGVSITDELREFANSYRLTINHRLLAIADRIDAEHKHAVMSAMNDALYHANDESMAELGWLRLPKDADGVSIYVGDRLDGYGKTIEVVELRYGRSGWVIVSRDGNAYADTFAFTHHRTPTVEDILTEFADEVRRCCDTADTIAEYAAELQMREG